eukprot:UN09539
MSSNQQSVNNSNTAMNSEQRPNSEPGLSCSDYFLYKIRKLSKSLSNNAIKVLSKSLTKLSRKQPETSTPSALSMTIQMGSAYLRRVDFSTIEPASMKRDDSAYFEQLFSPIPLDNNTTETVAGETPKRIKRKTVYSKSAS